MPTTGEVERHYAENPQPRRPRMPGPVHDGYAIASLVLSLLWLGGLGSILAIIFGALSCAEAGRAGRRNSGLAVAGIWVGGLGLIALVIVIAAAMSATTQPSCDLSNPAWPNC